MNDYQQRQRAESLYRLEEAEHLASYGIAPQEIAARLGTTRTALEQLARRHGRVDLARRLSAYRAAACPGCGEPMAPTATRCRDCVRTEGRDRPWSKQVPA